MIKNQIVDFHLISFSKMEFQNKILLQLFKSFLKYNILAKKIMEHREAFFAPFYHPS